MKLFKKLVYLLGILVLLAGLTSGFFAFTRHGLKKQLAHARMCYEIGDVAGAINLLELIYNKSPNSTEGEEAVYYLGKCYTNMNEHSLALHYWNILIGLDKEKYGAECLFNLANIMKQTERPDMSIKNYEQLINEYPNSDLMDDALLNLAVIRRKKGDLAEAQKELMNILESFPGTNLLSTVEKELGSVNIDLLFSSALVPGSTEYIVKEGDSLFVIAQQFGTTIDLIKKCNKLKSDFIKPKDKLKIVTDKFSVIADKSKNILTLKVGESVVKVYHVGTGVSGSTPAGIYKITNKLVNPPWHKPGEGVIPFGDPKNVLGTRWMGFNNPGYGIHGTWETDSIGKQSSAGCIRLLNEDVEELFQIVPVGTEVTIIE